MPGRRVTPPARFSRVQRRTTNAVAYGAAVYRALFEHLWRRQMEVKLPSNEAVSAESDGVYAMHVETESEKDRRSVLSERWFLCSKSSDLRLEIGPGHNRPPTAWLGSDQEAAVERHLDRCLLRLYFTVLTVSGRSIGGRIGGLQLNG